MNRIAVTIEDRTVYWDIAKEQAAAMLQVLVQTLGPAKEDEE